LWVIIKSEPGAAVPNAFPDFQRNLSGECANISRFFFAYVLLFICLY